MEGKLNFSIISDLATTPTKDKNGCGCLTALSEKIWYWILLDFFYSTHTYRCTQIDLGSSSAQGKKKINLCFFLPEMKKIFTFTLNSGGREFETTYKQNRNRMTRTIPENVSFYLLWFYFSYTLWDTYACCKHRNWN